MIHSTSPPSAALEGISPAVEVTEEIPPGRLVNIYFVWRGTESIKWLELDGALFSATLVSFVLYAILMQRRTPASAPDPLPLTREAR